AAMSSSQVCAVAMKAMRAPGSTPDTANRLLPLRAPPRTNSDDETMRPGPPAKTGVRVAPGQVSWLSDRPTPRAFPAVGPVAFAGFVPDYSDGVAADSHRLPWGPPWGPGRRQRADLNRAVPRPQHPHPGAASLSVCEGGNGHSSR